MKKYLVILLAGLSLLFASCASKGDIDDLQSQIDGLKSGQIASIESQISSINTSISALQETDRELKSYISALQSITADVPAIKTAIESLQERDRALEKMIEDLQSYVDTQLKNTKDWASATFATLDQYNRTVNEIERIKASIPKMAAIEAAYTQAINQAIASSESSLKNWVNEQLKGYWTIAETEAKLDALRRSLSKEDEAIRALLDSAKTELTEGYKAAIKKAIEDNNGVIDGKITEAISGLNTKIDKEISNINEKIEALEQRMSHLESYVMSRIQSLSYIPRYDDCASTMWYQIFSQNSFIARDTLDFRVSPADCADSLLKVWDKAVSAEAVSVNTRGTQQTVTLPVVSVTGGNGKISVVLDGSPLGEIFFRGEQKMKVVVIISDGNNELTSDYLAMIPKEDTTLPNNVILYTSVNEKIIVPNNTAGFGANIISNSYLNGKGVLVFDGDVTSIGISAFKGSGLSSIAIPNTVASIGGSAFSDCARLSSVKLSNSLSTIGYAAFHGCIGIESIDIPNSVTRVGGEAFSGCSALTSIEIPEGVSSIESETFQNCIGLTSVQLPNSLTIIGRGAFAGCTSLSSINIPDSVNRICMHSFYSCSSLPSIDIPDSVNMLDDSAFEDCTGLITVKLSNSLKSIAAFSFRNCSSLMSVEMPDNVERIKEAAFDGCRALTSIRIPDSVIYIENSVFRGCNLSSIIVDSRNPVYDSRDNCNAIIETKSNTLIEGCNNTIIPNSVTKIGVSAFWKCAGLTSIDIPNSVTSIGNSSFAYCSELISVKIPDSVTIIGDSAFWNCECLKSVQISGSETSIETHAFWGCHRLSSITALALVPNIIANDAFEGTNNCPIYVPAGSVEAYKAAQGWIVYADRIQAIPSPTPEAVDLGLSVKWASFNLGASKPEEYGDYYAWGETETKDSYSWSNYKYCKGSVNTITKYCSKSENGYIGYTDAYTQLESKDDAAYVILGEGWRIPNYDDWMELLNNCTRRTGVTINGVEGELYTSKIVGYTNKSIFLPKTGIYIDEVFQFPEYGYYWSSSTSTFYGYGYNAPCYQVGGSAGYTANHKSRGHSIRPVCSK